MQLVTAVVGVLAAGCSGQASVVGASEPFRVRGAQFVRGELPGYDPGDQTVDSTTPFRTSALSLGGTPILQGQGGRSLAGTVSTDAEAAAIAFDGYGTGYWVIPAGDPDATSGDLQFSGVADFDAAIQPGLQTLRAAALGPGGASGPQRTLKVCVGASVPDNFHGCDPTTPLPKAVISLSWDTNVDLDLQVLTPDGQLVEPKHPAVNTPDAGPPVALGTIDRDSNANCVVDGVRRENLVWPKETPSGLFQIFVNMADACKQPTVHFKVDVYTPEVGDDGTELQHQWVEKSGTLMDFQVGAGSTRGLFVTEFLFQ